MYDNHFIVMVDSATGWVRLLEDLITAFSGAVQVKANSCDLRGNWLEISPNDDADEKLATDPDTGYHYFRWRIEVTPLNESVGEDNQVLFARALLQHFRSGGARAEVLANFEDRL
ncbi:hypothetical protein AB0F72_22290 [Actinoplanes sp. NPDC023936]|uniref:hypothetical protein n=1 Tax=Actinoplanes sp. NPDC023936 TaxID=3154910 RepID=UPI003400AC85